MTKKEYFENQKGRYTKEELNWCSQFVKENWQKESEHILRIADEVCRLEFIFDLPWDMERTYEKVSFSGRVDWEFMPGDDPEFVYQMNRHRYFICLGQAYAMTNDEKYANAFVTLLMDWIERVPLNKNARELTWREIEAGLRGEYWTKAILYFEYSAYLTQEVMDCFIESLREHAEYLKNARRGFQVSSNWGILENHGLYLIGKALGKEGEVYVETALERLREAIQIQVLPDGVHWEQSCMYHNEVLHCILEVLGQAYLEDSIKTEHALIEASEKMSLANLAWIKPDHHQLLTGDSDDTDLRDMLCASAFLLDRAGKKETAQMLKYASYDTLDYESIWSYRSVGERFYGEILKTRPGKTDWILEESGNYYLRSGWDEEADLLHFRNGCLGGGHGHNDKLHIDLCIHGEDVLVDSGRYSYIYSETERVLLKSIKAHNTILADGRDYMEYPDSWSVLNNAVNVRCPVIIRDGITLLEGGHLGYMQNNKGIYINRKIIALEKGLYVLTDTAFSNEEHRYSRIFHFNNKGRVSSSGQITEYDGEKTKTQIHFPGENIIIKQFATKLSRHYNSIEDNQSVEVSVQGGKVTPMYTVIAGADREGKAVKVCLKPVENPVREMLLEPECAQGICVKTKEHSYIIIIRHMDLAGPADLLRVHTCMGIGRILISVDGNKPVVFA